MKTKSIRLIKSKPIQKTRYTELGIQQQGANNWRIIDLSTNSAIGAQYVTKTELLADLGNFAQQFGVSK